MSRVAHFSINADDLPRTRSFYEKVFGWKFQAWGPPGFYMIEMGAQDGVEFQGSLQQRRELVPGLRTNAFECTISVDDIHKAAAAVEANGGRIVMPICTLAGIGRLFFFQDPAGNQAGAMHYDASAQ
jgi:uncharacterized protein